MVNKDKIVQRLMKLEQTIKKLKKISCYDWDTYKRDEGLKDRVERNLQLAAQACIDIANHIVADSGYRASPAICRGNGCRAHIWLRSAS